MNLQRAGGPHQRRAAHQVGLHISVELHNRAGWRAAHQGWLADCTRAGRRAALKGGPAGCRTGRASGLQKRVGCAYIRVGALYKTADRSMQGRIALNIIKIASFRRSSRCATWRAVRYNIARTSCFENDNLSSLLHALEFFAARATAKQNNTPSYRY